MESQPETRAPSAEWTDSTAVVPQNKMVLVSNPGKLNKVVTFNVLDCVVLTFHDPVTKKGGLAHFPIGADENLDELAAELNNQGVNIRAMNFRVLGGNDQEPHWSKRSNSMIPSTSSVIVDRIARELNKQGIPAQQIKYDVFHSRQEKDDGKIRMGIDLNTGDTFYFTDSGELLDKKLNFDSLELQDRVTDLLIQN